MKEVESSVCVVDVATAKTPISKGDIVDVSQRGEILPCIERALNEDYTLDSINVGLKTRRIGEHETTGKEKKDIISVTSGEVIDLTTLGARNGNGNLEKSVNSSGKISSKIDTKEFEEEEEKYVSYEDVVPTKGCFSAMFRKGRKGNIDDESKPDQKILSKLVKKRKKINKEIEEKEGKSENNFKKSKKRVSSSSNEGKKRVSSSSEKKLSCSEKKKRIERIGEKSNEEKIKHMSHIEEKKKRDSSSSIEKKEKHGASKSDNEEKHYDEKSSMTKVTVEKKKRSNSSNSNEEKKKRKRLNENRSNENSSKKKSRQSESAKSSRESSKSTRESSVEENDSKNSSKKTTTTTTKSEADTTITTNSIKIDNENSIGVHNKKNKLVFSTPESEGKLEFVFEIKSDDSINKNNTRNVSDNDDDDLLNLRAEIESFCGQDNFSFTRTSINASEEEEEEEEDEDVIEYDSSHTSVGVKRNLNGIDISSLSEEVDGFEKITLVQVMSCPEEIISGSVEENPLLGRSQSLDVTPSSSADTTPRKSNLRKAPKIEVSGAPYKPFYPDPVSDLQSGLQSTDEPEKGEIVDGLRLPVPKSKKYTGDMSPIPESTGVKVVEFPESSSLSNCEEHSPNNDTVALAAKAISNGDPESSEGICNGVDFQPLKNVKSSISDNFTLMEKNEVMKEKNPKDEEETTPPTQSPSSESHDDCSFVFNRSVYSRLNRDNYMNRRTYENGSIGKDGSVEIEGSVEIDSEDERSVVGSDVLYNDEGGIEVVSSTLEVAENKNSLVSDLIEAWGERQHAKVMTSVEELISSDLNGLSQKGNLPENKIGLNQISINERQTNYTSATNSTKGLGGSKSTCVTQKPLTMNRTPLEVVTAQSFVSMAASMNNAVVQNGCSVKNGKNVSVNDTVSVKTGSTNLTSLSNSNTKVPDFLAGMRQLSAVGVPQLSAVGETSKLVDDLNASNVERSFNFSDVHLPEHLAGIKNIKNPVLQGANSVEEAGKAIELGKEATNASTKDANAISVETVASDKELVEPWSYGISTNSSLLESSNYQYHSDDYMSLSINNLSNFFDNVESITSIGEVEITANNNTSLASNGSIGSTTFITGVEQNSKLNSIPEDFITGLESSGMTSNSIKSTSISKLSKISNLSEAQSDDKLEDAISSNGNDSSKVYSNLVDDAISRQSSYVLNEDKKNSTRRMSEESSILSSKKGISSLVNKKKSRSSSNNKNESSSSKRQSILNDGENIKNNVNRESLTRSGSHDRESVNIFRLRKIIGELEANQEQINELRRNPYVLESDIVREIDEGMQNLFSVPSEMFGIESEDSGDSKNLNPEISSYMKRSSTFSRKKQMKIALFAADELSRRLAMKSARMDEDRIGGMKRESILKNGNNITLLNNFCTTNNSNILTQKDRLEEEEVDSTKVADHSQLLPLKPITNIEEEVCKNIEEEVSKNFDFGLSSTDSYGTFKLPDEPSDIVLQAFVNHDSEEENLEKNSAAVIAELIRRKGKNFVIDLLEECNYRKGDSFVAAAQGDFDYQMHDIDSYNKAYNDIMRSQRVSNGEDAYNNAYNDTDIFNKKLYSIHNNRCIVETKKIEYCH